MKIGSSVKGSSFPKKRERRGGGGGGGKGREDEREKLENTA